MQRPWDKWPLGLFDEQWVQQWVGLGHREPGIEQREEALESWRAELFVYYIHDGKVTT